MVCLMFEPLRFYCFKMNLYKNSISVWNENDCACAVWYAWTSSECFAPIRFRISAVSAQQTSWKIRFVKTRLFSIGHDCKCLLIYSFFRYNHFHTSTSFPVHCNYSQVKYQKKVYLFTCQSSSVRVSDEMVFDPCHTCANI